MMMPMTPQNGWLPQGTVTMLFSDIEGSTRLLSRLGDEYADALDAMRSSLRQAWAACGGVEMGTEGDSFFVVFEVARDAVARRSRRSAHWLASSWPTASGARCGWASTPARRSSMTAATSAWTCTGLRGSPRPRTAARSSCPPRSAELVAQTLSDGVALVDLGPHQLKDIAPARAPVSDHRRRSRR